MKIEGNFFNDSFKINDFKISFTFNHSFIIHSLFLNNQFVYLSINVKDFLSNHIFVIFMNIIYTPRD